MFKTLSCLFRKSLVLVWIKNKSNGPQHDPNHNVNVYSIVMFILIINNPTCELAKNGSEPKKHRSAENFTLSVRKGVEMPNV